MKKTQRELDDPDANLKAVSVALLIIIVVCTLALGIDYIVER